MALSGGVAGVAGGFGGGTTRGGVVSGVRSGGVGLGLIIEGGDGAEGIVARWVLGWGKGVVERVVEVVVVVFWLLVIRVEG